MEPGLSEAVKWGQPVFEAGGPVCCIKPYKSHVNFGFWRELRPPLPARLGAWGSEPCATSIEGNDEALGNRRGEDRQQEEPPHFDSRMVVIRFSGTATFSTLPLGQRTSTVSILPADPRPKCP